MPYRFSMEERELSRLLAATGTVGALLFAGGLLTGAGIAGVLRLPAAAPSVAAAAVPAPSAPAPTNASAPAAVPASPVSFARETDDAPFGTGGPAEEDLFPAAAAPMVTEPPAWARGGTEWALDGDGGEAADAADDWGEAVEASAGEARPAPPPARDFDRDPPRFSAYDGGGGPYALQVGRYGDEESAMEVMEDLRARGHEAYLYTEARGRAVAFHVRLGRYLDRAAAMRAVEALSRSDQLAALVVPAEGV